MEDNNMDGRYQVDLRRFIRFGLVFITLIAYWRVSQCDFINLDDECYVSENPKIRDGATWSGLAWAFSADLFVDAKHSDYWQPVIWISRMVDISIFGLNPGAHHLVNLAFHTLNVLLLFQVLLGMTQNVKRSAMVAALFAIHPLNVEAVAWITERKDVLAGFFGMLTLWAYLNFTKHRCGVRYGLVLLAFGCGLMSKPILSTLPFVLLLLDYWPLRRAKFELCDQKKWKHLMFEKIPLFVMSLASMGITLSAQQRYLEHASLWFAIKHAFLSYLRYLGKAIFPEKLAVYYPHAGKAPLFEAFGAALILGGIFWVAFRNFRKHSYLFVGWCWFMGMLLPVMGLNDIEGADRFTYLPLIGLFIALVWGGADIFSRMNMPQFLLSSIVACILLGLMVLTYIQVGYWRDSVTLWKRTLEVTDRNYLAHASLGEALLDEGRENEAIQHLTEAIRIFPVYSLPHYNLGLAFFRKNKMDLAILQHQEAIRLDPTDPNIYCGLGSALVHAGRIQEGMKFYQKGLQIDPGHADLQNNMGNAWLRLGEVEKSRKHYEQALSLQPFHADANYNMGNALATLNRINEATVFYARAIQANPEHTLAHYNLAICLAKQGKSEQAAMHLEIALKQQPDFKPAQEALARLRAASMGVIKK